MRVLRYSLLALFAFLTITAHSDEVVWLSPKQAINHYADGREELLQAMSLMHSDEEQARALLLQSRVDGHPFAYLMCSVFANSEKERIELLRFAKSKRVQMAVYRLGDVLYCHGRGLKSGWKEAHGLFLQASNWGNKDAAFYAGRMYHFGHGTEQDYVLARDYYQKAIKNGSIRAANNLANLHADGLGGPVDTDKYMELMQYASDKGMAMASYNMGLHFLNDAENAPDWIAAEPYFELAWEQSEGNYASVAYQLGRIAQFDYTGKGKDYTKAADYYTLAAEEKDRAAYHLGRFYRDGLGVEQDIEKALHYYKLSAEAKNSRALFAIGWLNDSGQLGVPDYKAAIGYYEQAAELGNDQAKANLAWLYWENSPETKQEDIHRLSREAIEAENLTAIINYGYLNLYEKLEKVDIELGLKLTTQAAEAGQRASIENLMYYYEGSGELREPDTEKAAHWRKRLAER